MTDIQQIFNTTIELNTIALITIAVIYIIVHQQRDKTMLGVIDIYLSYIPVLTHEIGHIVFNKVSGGKAQDLVIIVSPSERQHTSQQGFAITQSKHRIGQILTTLGGYLMPPMMLALGLLCINAKYPSIFFALYLLIFIYFFILTSRKLFPLLMIVVLGGLLYIVLDFSQADSIFNILLIGCHIILGVLLGEVIQSTLTILKLTFSSHHVEWDGTNLRDLTHLPVICFSAVWVAFNLYTLYQLVSFYIL